MYLPSNMASFWVSILYMLNFKGASPCLVYSWVLKNRHRLWLIWSDLGWRIFQTFLVLHFLLESPGQLWQFGWYWSCATDGIKSSYSWNKAWFEVILFGTIGTLWKSDFGNLPFCRCVFLLNMRGFRLQCWFVEQCDDQSIFCKEVKLTVAFFISVSIKLNKV